MSVTEAAGAMDFTGEIQEALERRVGRELYRLWFGQIAHCHREGNNVQVDIGAQFALDRIASRYMSDLRAAVVDVCGDGTTVSLEMAKAPKPSQTPEIADATDEASQSPSHAKPVPSSNVESGRGLSRPSKNGSQSVIKMSPSVIDASGDKLPPRRQRLATWENIVTGNANKLAVTAARMVCEQPGNASPLFLWGGHGVGKSQLLDVIGNELRRRHRMRRVISMTAEEFTNDFIGSVTGSGLPGFRRRYRDVDALMIDDVQFLPGKRATTREMLYTIDSVVRSGKQLIFTADRAPLEIAGMGQDLGGRMASGMVCGLSALDQSMRTEILQGLCDADELPIDRSLLPEIASRVCGDGRVLAGIACRLKALVAMHEGAPEREDVMEMLGDLFSVRHAAYGFTEIASAVCTTLGLPKDSLQSKGQSRNVSLGRMLAMYLAREHTGATYGEIGKYFGHRSHSTAIASTRRIAGDVATGKEFKIGRRSVAVRQVLESVETALRSG